MSIPFDRVIVLDMESAWASKPYVDKLGNEQPPLTLSKQTTEQYLRDPRFKAWGLCWKDLGAEGAATWVRRNQLHEFFKSIEWSRTAVVCQNSAFDVAILEWLYDVHPVFVFDTLSMARALYGVEVGNSLAKLAERFELPPKGKAVHSTDGILDELPFDIETELADYCRHDVFLCEEIFKRLADGYPRGELELIDITIKMFTQPRLELDAEMLDKELGEERVAREELLTKLAVTDADLASNDRFAEILEKLGAIPPRKPKKPTKKTPNPVGELYAFAKTDAMFQAMLNGDNEDVALLCEARLKVKSTQERTRAQRFLDISMRGTLPVPLNYCGAQTLRWTASKGSSINMQNMRRGSFLRKAIMAPAGHQIVVSDLSQIEPRVLAYLSGYQKLLDIFAAGKDAYAEFGATMFNKPGLSKETDPLLRQSAKSALLGCLGANVQVKTKNSNGTICWKPIHKIKPTDPVWDGIEWVRHGGVAYQGRKRVIEYGGVVATHDHEFLVGEDWVSWHEYVMRARKVFGAVDGGVAHMVDVDTYDIVNSGPRNRFTIRVHPRHDVAMEQIVHNCGYYLGWASFAAQLLVGFLGAPPVRYDRAFAKMLGVTQGDLIAFTAGKAGEARMDRMAEIPHLCTDEELFVHCVCAKRIIDTYRATASPVTDYWALLQDLIETSLYGGEVYEHKCLRFEKERIVLPNGMALRYPDLQSEKDKKGNVEWTYAVGPMRKKLHAGVLAENTTSALSRVVMSDAMRRIHKRYPILFSVHDEAVVLCPDREIEEGKAWIHAQMLVDPKYLPGIPLGAETGAHRRYGLAKA